jgi:hypothetical protein
MRFPISLFLAAVLLVAADDASAQRMPGRDRGGSPRGDATGKRDNDAQRATAPALVQDPFAALERELPSLKVDLLINAGQVEAWVLFERDVRDVAEMDRTRRRHVLSLRESGERAPTAVAVIATLAEDDRQKADATLDMKRHLEALYEKLDESQRRTLDRRVLLSQSDPLGR